MKTVEWYTVDGYNGVFFKISENGKQLLLGGINGSQWCDKNDCKFVCSKEVQDGTE